MADKLSLPNLLSLLDIKSQDDAAVLKHCYKAEELRRRRCHDEAIKTAEYALQLAQGDPNTNYHLHGVALMYLCAARLSTSSRAQHRQAMFNCDRAIGSFHLEPYNRAIAEIVRALTELEDVKDVAHKKRAIIHLKRAVEVLQTLDRDHRISLEGKKVAVEVQVAVNDRLLALTSSVRDISMQPKQQGHEARANERAAEANLTEFIPASIQRPPIDLPVPTQLVWPIPNTHDMEPMPVQVKHATQVHGESSLDQDAHDRGELSQFSIRGNLYEAHPIGSATNVSETFRYSRKQSYIAIPLVEHKKGRSNRYVLVRRHDQPDQANQKVVVADLRHKRAWVWMATDDLDSIPPKIIGGIDDIQVGIQDLWDRDAQRRRTAKRITGDVQMIGVVEAILIPVAFSESSPSPVITRETMLANTLIEA